jgi:hypothetical protein
VSALLPLILISTSTSISDRDLDARLAFLDESLQAPQQHAKIWWWGWLAFYSAAAVVEAARIPLVKSTDEDAAAQRADLALSTVKAIGGVLSIVLRPLDAMEGAHLMRRVEGSGRDAKLVRLAVGEAALERNTRESERSFSWLRHTILVLANVAHGLIVWLGYDDLQRGAISTGLGLAFGELVIWTQPWEPRASLEEYQAAWPSAP